MLLKNQTPGEFIGSKIAQAVTKSNNNKILKQEPFEEIVILQEKRGTVKQIEKSFIKMEHHEISKLLKDSPVSNFVTKKWVEVNDLSSGQYSINKSIRIKTWLRSDLRDYSDAYIVVKRIISLTGTNANNRRNKKLAFKNNGLFRSCI